MPLKNTILAFFISLAALVAAGCSSTPEKPACEQRDWYESGRRDGSQGAPLDRLASYKLECGAEFSGFWETMYTNGRNAGLVEYCSSENSFELGRMGIAYLYVCPSTTEGDFLAGYRRGQRARQLEIENQRLDQEIDTLLSRINAENSKYARRELASELDQLRKLRSQNEKNLNKISNRVWRATTLRDCQSNEGNSWPSPAFFLAK